MITQEQKDKLMQMINSYGVSQSIRGLWIGKGNEGNEKVEERFVQQKLEQIENFLDNILVNSPSSHRS